jgi:hypothetical protein
VIVVVSDGVGVIDDVCVMDGDNVCDNVLLKLFDGVTVDDGVLVGVMNGEWVSVAVSDGL